MDKWVLNIDGNICFRFLSFQKEKRGRSFGLFLPPESRVNGLIFGRYNRKIYEDRTMSGQRYWSHRSKMTNKYLETPYHCPSDSIMINNCWTFKRAVFSRVPGNAFIFLPHIHSISTLDDESSSGEWKERPMRGETSRSQLYCDGFSGRTARGIVPDRRIRLPEHNNGFERAERPAYEVNHQERRLTI